MASTIASTLDLSRPSEKFGTHSTSVDITDEDSWRRVQAQGSELKNKRLTRTKHSPQRGQRNTGSSQRLLPPENFPIPSLTCNVLIPGLGTAKPAFEMCI